MNAIEVYDIRKYYPSAGGGPIHALDGVSFEVPEGRIFGLLGPNGAGKSITHRQFLVGKIVFNLLLSVTGSFLEPILKHRHSGG